MSWAQLPPSDRPRGLLQVRPSLCPGHERVEGSVALSNPEPQGRGSGPRWRGRAGGQLCISPGQAHGDKGQISGQR